jgi:hypothetical protein
LAQNKKTEANVQLAKAIWGKDIFMEMIFLKAACLQPSNDEKIEPFSIITSFDIFPSPLLHHITFFFLII